MIKGVVYLLMVVDDYGKELYKIGITKRDPKIRVIELSTGNPKKISLIKTYTSENYLKVERWMHKKYSMNKTEANNEWRELDNDSVANFLADCAEADDTIKFLKINNHFYD